MNALLPGPSFASDNWSGLCPEALESLIQANQGSVSPYGSDPITKSACSRLQTLFDHEAEIFFVVSGTAGNSLALAHLAAPFESILCHQLAHIRVDECGAPGFFSNGASLIPISTRPDARIDEEDLSLALSTPSDLRFPPPKVLSLTQTTERGTLYTPSDIQKLADQAHHRGLSVHMDGARFLQAVEALEVSPSELSWEVGVDVLTLGTSKIGGGLGDAVIFFDPALARGFLHRMKQAGQVPAKTRFLAAPWNGLLESNAWARHAYHANAMAADLSVRLRDLGILPVYPRESNMVFVAFSEADRSALQAAGWVFHTSPDNGTSRLVCGWDATPAQNQAFIDTIVASRQ